MYGITYQTDCVHAGSVNMFKNKIDKYLVKGALYRIWCGVNLLGDSGVKVV